MTTPSKFNEINRAEEPVRILRCQGRRQNVPLGRSFPGRLVW